MGYRECRGGGGGGGGVGGFRRTGNVGTENQAVGRWEACGVKYGRTEFFFYLRRLTTVSSFFKLLNFDRPVLLFFFFQAATIMISNECPIIAEQVVVFLTTSLLTIAKV